LFVCHRIAAAIALFDHEPLGVHRPALDVRAVAEDIAQQPARPRLHSLDVRTGEDTSLNPKGLPDSLAGIHGIEFSRDGGTYRISSRPSDAIALAVRYGDPVPIFAHEDVLEEAGVLFEQDEDEEQIEQFREFLDQVRPEDFAHGE
jgi:hypothetical protein